MTPEEIRAMQEQLDLSDRKMAVALGVTRQTWRNWRVGRACPLFVQKSLRCMMELRRLDPANDNLPPGVRVKLALMGAVIVVPWEWLTQAA